MSQDKEELSKEELNAQLREAVIDGKQALMDSILAKGAEVNHQTAGGLTPLHWAVIKGHFGIVKHLIEKGADMHHRSKSGMAPIDEAVVRGRLNMIKLLAEKGVNIVDAFDRDGQAPIHVAAREGFLPVVKYLVEEAKVTVWLNNKQHVRALNIARQSLKDRPTEEARHKEVIYYLYELEANGMGGDPPASSYLPEAAKWAVTAK